MEKSFNFIHIHTDIKFINDIERYYNDIISNKLIIISERDMEGTIECDDYTLYEPQLQNIGAILRELNAADVVVINGLTDYVTRLIEVIPSGIKIVWRFFGFELYSRKESLFLSESSKEHFSFPSLEVKEFLRRSLRKEKRFKNALRRINCFICLNKFEYALLQTHWRHLPEFVQINVFSGNRKVPNSFKDIKTGRVIIGNSKSAFNNHLDIFEIIRANKNDSFEFILPFNYGPNTNYSEKVLSEAKEIGVNVIDNFLPKKEYISVFGNADAFIHNGYRQMAFANIIFSIENGLKIYLNPRNSLFTWLTDQGLKIFSIEDFRSDLCKDDVSLNNYDKKLNVVALQNLRINYSKKDFQLGLLHKLSLS